MLMAVGKMHKGAEPSEPGAYPVPGDSSHPKSSFNYVERRK